MFAMPVQVATRDARRASRSNSRVNSSQDIRRDSRQASRSSSLTPSETYTPGDVTPNSVDARRYLDREVPFTL